MVSQHGQDVRSILIIFAMMTSTHEELIKAPTPGGPTELGALAQMQG
jgi:hypothetical protein